MYRFPLAAALVLAASTTARAQCGYTHVVSDSFGPQFGNWPARQLAVPRFQPGPGQTLVAASVVLELSLDGMIRFENRDPLNGCVVVLESAIRFTALSPIPGLESIDSLLSFVASPLSLGPYDGIVDFAGPSGVTLTDMTDSLSMQVTIVDPVELAAVFTGAGEIVLTHSANDESSQQGRDAMTFLSDPLGQITLTVTYETCELGTRFCDASDGALASCPCLNAGDPDAGCDIAQSTGGVTLWAAAQDTQLRTATLQTTGFPAASAPGVILLRSPAVDPAAPVVFGDGLRCVGAAASHMAAALAAGGMSTHPIVHEPGAGPGTYYYQAWFRNEPMSFCDPLAAFNLSSGRVLVWP
jgi:hypothetical protein